MNTSPIDQEQGKKFGDRWTFEQIELMSTDEILTWLNCLGIPVTPESFRQATQRHESAEYLGDELGEQYPIHPQGRYDTDFVWMSMIVLWKRLLPDHICVEQIDEQMQIGYTLLEQQHTVQACDAWWQVWEWLKDKVTPERNTLDALNKAFRRMYSVYSWCQDFEMELGNAGLADAKYHRLRIRYCREFLELFSDIEWLLRGNFLRAEAESYWQLGDIGTAEDKFETLIQANPDWVWGYIGWSDCYWLDHGNPKDYAKGKVILKRALRRHGIEDRDVVRDRLKDLRIERAQTQKRSTRTRPGKKQKR